MTRNISDRSHASGRLQGSDEEDHERLIKPWKAYPQRFYRFINANVIDPEKGIVHHNATVHISEGMITEVTLKDPSPHTTINTTTVDLQGKYLCPGLWDNHVHIRAVPGDASWRDTQSLDPTTSTLRQAFVCKQMLARGFTTVRDCGGADLALKRAISDNLVPGPRLLIAGKFISQTGGHGDTRSALDDSTPSCCAPPAAGSPNFPAYVVDGVPACLSAARSNLRQGADFLKIMSSGGVASPTDAIDTVQFTPEEVRAITTCAANAGTYVTAHAYTPAAIRQALANGVEGIEHGNLIDRATAKLMVEMGAYLTPTLTTYAAMAGERYKGYMPGDSLAKNKLVLEAGLVGLKIASDAGVQICYGSDLLGYLGAAQSDEFALRAKVLRNEEVLRSATVTPARMNGMSATVGRIEGGFVADMLVLNRNPLEDVTVLARPEKCILAVIKDGRVVVSRWSKLAEDFSRPTEMIE